MVAHVVPVGLGPLEELGVGLERASLATGHHQSGADVKVRARSGRWRVRTADSCVVSDGSCSAKILPWHRSPLRPMLIDMSRSGLDTKRGHEVAVLLKALGVTGILISAAQKGYITEFACKMPEYLCPKELGGNSYFEPVAHPSTDWMPTHEHFPRPKREGGHRDLDNSILAHCLCNRVDYSKSIGRPYAKDLARVQAAREEAIRQSDEE